MMASSRELSRPTTARIGEHARRLPDLERHRRLRRERNRDARQAAGWHDAAARRDELGDQGRLRRAPDLLPVQRNHLYRALWILGGAIVAILGGLFAIAAALDLL